MEIKKIGIAGAGTMGSSMAQIFARFGYEVCLYKRAKEGDGDPFGAVKERIRNGMMVSAEQGLMEKDRVEEALGRITCTTSMEELARCPMIVENIPENIEVKHAFYREISSLTGPETILATNTSGLSINRLAEAVKDPERFLGFHWLNPSHLIPLVEIIRGDVTRDDVAETVYQAALSIHKKPAMVNRDVPGFGVNRLQFALVREALSLVEEGVMTPESIDAVLKYGLGFRWACLGPLETMDFGGLDIFYHVASYLMEDLNDSHEAPKALREAYESGNLGVKTGKGFYSYEGTAAAQKTAQRDERLIRILKALELQ